VPEYKDKKINDLKRIYGNMVNHITIYILVFRIPPVRPVVPESF